MFFIGMLVAEIWMRKLVSLSKATARIGTIIALVVMLSARFIFGYASKWSLLFEGFASGALIAALVLGPRFSLHDVLEMKPFRFLGRISYSYYLYHPLALAVFVPTLTNLVSPSWLQAHPFLSPGRNRDYNCRCDNSPWLWQLYLNRKADDTSELLLLIAAAVLLTIAEEVID